MNESTQDKTLLDLRLIDEKAECDKIPQQTSDNAKLLKR